MKRYILAAILFAAFATQALAQCVCPDCKCKPGVCPDCPVGASVGGFTTPSGKDAACPLPEEFHLTNRGGSDGLGLCVFCSIQHCAVWASVPELEDMFPWMWNKPGGGYPSKVDKMIAQKCKEIGKPVPAYVQIEGQDLTPIRLACKTGRMVGVTYGISPTGRYRGQRISHMVNVVHADDEWFGVLDNNYPKSVEWMTEAEFKRSYYRGGSGSGWAFILLEPGPPPPPYTPNLKPREHAMSPLPLLIASLALNGWGPSCGPVGSPAPVQVQRAATYSWEKTSNANQLALYLGNVQVGNWWIAEGVYKRLDGNRWTVAECPIEPPARKIEELPTGVEPDKIADNRYSFKGRDCSRKQVLDAIEGNLVDDSGLMWVTVIGSPAERGPVLADLQSNPALAAYRDKIKVKGYDAGHWAVAEMGFPHGKPSIHIEGSDGASLWRQDDYTHGANGLAAALEWCERKQRPDYDPTKDPGPGLPWRKPDPVPAPAPAPEPVPEPAPEASVQIPAGTCGGCAVAVLAALAAFLLTRKSNDEP